MKLSECKLGTVVRYANHFYEKNEIGHIIGLGLNSFGETIPIVKWNNGTQTTTHNYNLRPYSDEENIKPEKTWPNSFEEAMKISRYWGLTVHSPFNGISCYMILPDNFSDSGSAVNLDGCWADVGGMKAYWEKFGVYNGIKYDLKKFNSARELYLWMEKG